MPEDKPTQAKDNLLRHIERIGRRVRYDGHDPEAMKKGVTDLISAAEIYRSSLSNPEPSLSNYFRGLSDEIGGNGHSPHELREALLQAENTIHMYIDLSGTESKPDIYMDPKKPEEVWVRGEPIRLDPTESRVLRYMIKNVGKTLSHTALLRNAWGSKHYKPEIVRAYVGRLRRKIELNPSNPEHIIFMKGFGYRFENSSNGHRI